MSSMVVPAIACLMLGQTKLPADDLSYLRSLAKDTWLCIGWMVSPASGLPYDNSDRGEYTSVSNIGMYLSDVVVAFRLGLITQAEERQRLNKTLKSLESLKTWYGFQQCWNSVETLEPAKHDTAVSLIDSGNLAASLLAVGQAEPAYATRCRALFDRMRWNRFYDKEQNSVLGGYDTAKGTFNPQWHLDTFATDAMLAVFFTIATDGAPASVWQTLRRETETRDGQTYLKPGWQGGGLFMQYISGLWLDERGTEIGRSARRFAQAQIDHAKAIGAPLWGWSACDNPDGGYLGWGALKDEVVTPHASALAVEFFPEAVTANLREFERLGCRSKVAGFFDSYNWQNKKVGMKMLMLDQSMIFLSLGNYLKGNVLRTSFQKDPVVRRGRALLPL